MNKNLTPNYIPEIMTLGELQNLTDLAGESLKVTNQIPFKSMIDNQIKLITKIFSLIGHYT